MKKITALALIILLAFCGCGKASSEEAQADPRTLANDLASQLSYDDPPTEIPSEDVLMYMELPEGAEGAFFKSSGSTAEAVAVFSCKDSAGADQIQAAYDKYLDEQQELFAAYDPEEVAKVENHLLYRKGNTVVLCICSDKDAAQKIVDEAFR